MKKYFFLAGLPRSGNTLLSTILNQNPDLKVSSNSFLTEHIFDELIKKEKVKLSKKNISRGFQALIMGLWLDQLEDPDTFNRIQAKKICFEFIKSNFPKQFKGMF